VFSSSSFYKETPLFTFYFCSLLILFLYQNQFFFSQTHSAYLQTVVVCYDPVVAMETALVALDKYQALNVINPQLNADAFCDKSFITGLFR